MRITMTALTWAMPFLLAVLGIVAGEQSSVREGQAAESGTMAKAYFAGGCFWCMEGVRKGGRGPRRAVRLYGRKRQESEL